MGSHDYIHGCIIMGPIKGTKWGLANDVHIQIDIYVRA